MLSEMCKKHKIGAEIAHNNPFFEYQFGFRESRSTIHAVSQVVEKVLTVRNGCCTLITIDVKNAFSRASWRVIRERLRDKIVERPILGVVERFIRDREINHAPGRKMEQIMVVSQGLVLGLSL